MRYEIEFKPKAFKDLDGIPSKDATRVLDRIEKLSDNLTGNVKHLTNFAPKYRLRVGDYRVLFEVENHVVMVYRVLHRREAYR